MKTAEEFFNKSEFTTEQDGTPVRFEHMQVYTARDMCEFAEAYAQEENKALQAEVDRKDKFIDDVRLFIKSPHSSKDSAYWHKLKQLNDDIDKI